MLRIAHASAHVLFYTYHALYTRCARARYEGDPHACALHACALHALYTRLTRFICALNALYTFFLYMRFARALHALYAFHTRCARVRYEGDLEDDQLIRNADKQARTYMHACIHTYMHIYMHIFMRVCVCVCVCVCGLGNVSPASVTARAWRHRAVKAVAVPQLRPQSCGPATAAPQLRPRNCGPATAGVVTARW